MNNATRISWIDSAEVADLLRQLEGPLASPPPGAWELHTLPTQVAEQPVSLIPSLAPEPPPDLAPEPSAPSAPAEHEENAPPLEKIGLEQPTPPDILATEVDPSPALEPLPLAAPPLVALPVLTPSTPMTSTLPTSVDGDSEIQRIRLQLRELRQRAQQSGMFSATTAQRVPTTTTEAPPPVPEPEPAPEAPGSFSSYFTSAEAPTASTPSAGSGFVPPAAGLSDRLAALRHWVMQQTSSDEVQLVDDVGEVLQGASERSSWIISTLMASQAQIRANLGAPVTSESRFIYKELSLGRILTLIPVASCYGQVTVAILHDQPIPTEVAQRIESAVKSATDYQLPPQQDPGQSQE
jgi:hypothetical protein